MITSTMLVPDLQYWFENFVKNSNLNKDITPFPITFTSLNYIQNISFIRLLFDDNWPTTQTYYNYYFVQNLDMTSIPSVFRTRLMVYPQSGQYYNCVDSSTPGAVNLFLLQSDDIMMLNQLLAYRIDSTSSLTVNFSSLETPLSQLIYMYLDLKINNNYSHFDNTTTISTKLIEYCYELYVCENLFNYLSNNGQ